MAPSAATSQMSENPSVVASATAPTSPSADSASPRPDEYEYANACMTRPPSSGAMGSMLKRLMSAHQAATVAQAGSRVHHHRAAGASARSEPQSGPLSAT